MRVRRSTGRLPEPRHWRCLVRRVLRLLLLIGAVALAGRYLFPIQSIQAVQAAPGGGQAREIVPTHDGGAQRPDRAATDAGDLHQIEQK